MIYLSNSALFRTGSLLAVEYSSSENRSRGGGYYLVSS